MSFFEEKQILQRHYFQLGLLLITIIFFFVIQKESSEIFLFSFGFVWQWADQFDYVSTRSNEKKYRFSFLRFYWEVIRATHKLPNRYLKFILSTLAPAIFMGLVFSIFQTPFYIHEIIIGSFFMSVLKMPLFRGTKSLQN